MDITGIVQRESHGSGETLGFRMSLKTVSHDLGVSFGVLVTIFLVEPALESTEGLSNVVNFKGEVVVTDITTLVEEWCINEVPS